MHPSSEMDKRKVGGGGRVAEWLKAADCNSVEIFSS